MPRPTIFALENALWNALAAFGRGTYWEVYSGSWNGGTPVCGPHVRVYIPQAGHPDPPDKRETARIRALLNRYLGPVYPVFGVEATTIQGDGPYWSAGYHRVRDPKRHGVPSPDALSDAEALDWFNHDLAPNARADIRRRVNWTCLGTTKDPGLVLLWLVREDYLTYLEKGKKCRRSRSTS